MKITTVFRFLNEAQLMINKKSSKNGNIVFLVGGGGSGKDFILNNALSIDRSNAKVFDVDKFKELVLYSNPLFKDQSLSNGQTTADIHDYVSAHDLDYKSVSTFISSIKSSKEKPNIIFNVTGKHEDDIIDKLKYFLDSVNDETSLFDLYDSTNIHIIWVLTPYKDALANNNSRPRRVPENILYRTHKGVSKVFANLLSGVSSLTEYINGEIFIIFNKKGVDFSTTYKGHEGGFVKRSNTSIKHYNRIHKSEDKSGLKLDKDSTIPNIVGKLNYVKIKEKGKRVKSFRALPIEVQNKIKEYLSGL